MKAPIFPTLSIPDETKVELTKLRNRVVAARQSFTQQEEELAATENRIEGLRLKLPDLTSAAADADPDAVNALVVCERQITILQEKAEAQSEAVAVSASGLKGALVHAAGQFRAHMPAVFETLLSAIREQIEGFCSHPQPVNEFIAKTDAVTRFRYRYFDCFFTGAADPKDGVEMFLSYFEELLPGESAAV
jgi:hypothetical protein